MVTSHHPTRFIVGTTVYFGVIDILQRWTLKKKLERFAKTVLLRHDAKGITATDCDFYQKRFVKSVVNDVFATESS